MTVIWRGDGVAVDFFGEGTTMPGGPATLALRTGAPLIPAGVYFRPRGGHSAIIGPPLVVEREGRLRDDVARITQELTRRFEELIRMAPEQWHLMQPNWPSDARLLAAPQVGPALQMGRTVRDEGLDRVAVLPVGPGRGPGPGARPRPRPAPDRRGRAGHRAV